jgi:hypothetical protein
LRDAMSLNPGARLGRRDGRGLSRYVSRLGRDVALKILPAEFARDPGRQRPLAS